MIDVLVVGGGPAGLLSAARLAELGLDVVLFEEHASIGEPTHCTGIVSLETTEFAKVPDEIVLNRLHRAKLVAPGGSTCAIVWDSADQEQIVAIDRAAFDRSLAHRAVRAGVSVRTGSRVDALAVEGDRVQALVAGERVSARACIVASGVSYRLARQLGLGLPAAFIHSAQLEVPAEALDQVEMYVGHEVAPDGFAWIVPVRRCGEWRAKVGVMARRDAEARLNAFVARPAIRGRLKGGGTALCRLLPLAPSGKTYAERVLIVGDAAGLTKPTTGGGIFYSLLSASLAADTMAEAFQAGQLDEEFLARYERRWRERLGQELRIGAWLRRVLTRFADADLDRLVESCAAGDLGALLRTGRFNWHRSAVTALIREPQIGSILLRALLR